MFALICVAVLALFFIDWGDKTPPVAQRDEAPSSKRADPDPDPPNNDDTGIAAPPPPQATRTRRTTPRASGTSSSAAPAAPRVSGGNVVVKLADTSQASGVELVCGGGSYRLRKSFGGGTANFSGVPGGQCTLYFKGGIPAKFTPVSRGKSYNCSIIGTTAVCK